jgi:hypothetical protein
MFWIFYKILSNRKHIISEAVEYSYVFCSFYLCDRSGVVYIYSLIGVSFTYIVIAMWWLNEQIYVDS